MLKSTEHNVPRAPHRADQPQAQQEVVLAVDSQNRVTAWNQAAETLFGWPAAQVLGRDFTSLFQAGSHEVEKLQAVIACTRQAGRCREELTIKTRAGSSLLVEADAVSLFDPQTGQPGGAVLLLRDISLRRLMQDGAKASEQRLRAVLEHIPVGVWLLNSAGQIVLGNQAGQVIWEGARFVGLDHFGEYRARWLETGELLKPEEWAGYRAVTFGETSLNELLEIECFDGSRKVIRNSCLPFWEHGELLGAVVVNEDITDLRQVQEALKHYTVELERSNRDLQDYAFVASHDLQEPLRKIQAFGSLLQRRLYNRLDPESAGYLARIQQASERLQRMIDDLLAYARLTSHDMAFEEVDLQAVLKEALANLEQLQEVTGGQLQLADDLPGLRGDHRQLVQLFQNLLANALKFHPPGTPPRVAVELQADTHQEVRVAVRDQGIGFDMAQAERIFQPFHRLKGRAEYQGNGIGLAICRRIVERHGGKIEVSSAPGAGSTFVVTLPKLPPDAGESAPYDRTLTGDP